MKVEWETAAEREERELKEWIDKSVAEAPPFSQEKRERLGRLLGYSSRQTTLISDLSKR